MTSSIRDEPACPIHTLNSSCTRWLIIRHYFSVRTERDGEGHGAPRFSVPAFGTRRDLSVRQGRSEYTQHNNARDIAAWFPRRRDSDRVNLFTLKPFKGISPWALHLNKINCRKLKFWGKFVQYVSNINLDALIIWCTYIGRRPRLVLIISYQSQL